MDRRRFLKYAGAAAVAGAAALGLDYLNRPGSSNLDQILDRTPPIIKDFQFQPTRVVNGKVYDATISFIVEDAESGVADASGSLEGYAPTIPARACPAEPSRTLSLAPAQSSGKSVAFSAQCADLKGGKKYQASVIAKDSANNQAQSQYDTPYVRELENISGKDNILVGAFYHPWWKNPCPEGFCHWGEITDEMSKGTTGNGTPLLGLYNSDDPLVISKHIDWATGHGIDYFMISWANSGPRSGPSRTKSILENPLIEQIKFAIFYETLMLGPTEENVNLNESATYARFQADLEYVARNYFTHPSYLRIDGVPVLHIYGSEFTKGDIAEPMKKVRQHLRDLGFEVYLIGDEMRTMWKEEIDLSRLKAFDAVTDYGLPPPRFKDMSSATTRSEYARWRSVAHSVGVELIPAPYPGTDDRVVKSRTTHVFVPKSTEFFATNLRIAMEFVDRNQMLNIVSWDEWAENSYIEPSVEDDFKYLQTLRDTLAEH